MDPQAKTDTGAEHRGDVVDVHQCWAVGSEIGQRFRVVDGLTNIRPERRWLWPWPCGQHVAMNVPPCEGQISHDVQELVACRFIGVTQVRGIDHAGFVRRPSELLTAQSGGNVLQFIGTVRARPPPLRCRCPRFDQSLSAKLATSLRKTKVRQLAMSLLKSLIWSKRACWVPNTGLS